MIWFLDSFIEIYGERLKTYDIDKDFINTQIKCYRLTNV